MRQPGFRLAAAATCLFVGIGSAGAFEVPDGQSCGGLVCDLGLFGHKTEPKPAVSAAPLPSAPAAAVDARHDEIRKPEAPRPVHAAKPRVVRTQVAKIQPATMPVAKTVAAPAKAAVRLDALPSAGMASAVGVPTPLPVPAAPVVLVNPYVYSKPQPIQFQSVDPSAALQ